MNDTGADTNQMKRDNIEVIGDSLIQHGKLSDRVYLMRISETDDTQAILDAVKKLVTTHKYSKVFGKVPEKMVPGLLENGFHHEAIIPGFYYGKTDAFLMSSFFDNDRSIPEPEALKNFRDLLNGFDDTQLFHPDKEVSIMELEPKHALPVTEVYKKVFESYPFPIHDPDYIIDTMKSHVRYFGIWEGSRLMAVSSAEIDAHYQNAELTDFAVDPDFRGRRLASYLLHEMEKQLVKDGLKTGYTIARLHSPAMNLTFMKNGYKYSGTLVKNTNIAGKIESMNVFYKPLK